MKLIALLLFSFVGFTQSALAYFVATPTEQGRIDYSRPTRILLSGRGTDLGLQPQQSALGSALLYRVNFPGDQVVLISVLENDGNETKLLKAQWTIIEKNDVRLETRAAVAEIAKFKRIQSINFFGHNSPSLGTQTDGSGYRFDFRDKVIEKLTPLFMPGAFAFIHGCNSGWIIAPQLANTWKVPVAASLTQTRFERLHSDGHFYVYTDSKAPNPNWATHNPDLGVPCSAGGCIRMRPAFSTYRGHWGDFDGPLLSHYKFFCTLETKECEKRMATALYGFLAERSLKPDSTFDDFRQVAKEFLCPIYKDRVVTNDCLHQLDLIEQGQGDPSLHYIVANDQLACGFQGCQAKMSCTNNRCTISDRVSKNSTTLTVEYLHFMRGYFALKSKFR